MDLWCRRHRGSPYDDGGAWAAGGQVDREVLGRLLAEPFFALAPPKSTGRDLFGAAWLDARLGTASPDPQDVMATLAEVTARAAVEGVRRHAPSTSTLLVCGGGACNRHLMSRLVELAGAGIAVASTATVGLAPERVEALAFAWLARAHLRRTCGNLPSVTGARGPRVLGALYPA
jgi:anhydro-N-acetylmuramic acid kinase